MYVLFEIVFVVFNYYCFEGHREDYLIVANCVTLLK